MKSPSNAAVNAPNNHIMSPCKTFSDRNGLHLVESLPK